MKKNDSKLYLYFSIISCAIGILLAFIFCYSAFIVEPEIQRLLDSRDDVNGNLRNAYISLRNPQIFARYEKFDRVASPISTIIKVYDKKIDDKEKFAENDKIYLQILLDRRKLGAGLTRNTSIFFILLSITGWIFYFFELFQNKPREQKT